MTAAIAASYIEGPAQDWSALLLTHQFHASAGVAAAGPLAISVGIVASRMAMDPIRRRHNSSRIAGFAAGGVAAASLAGYALSVESAPPASVLVLFVLVGIGTGPIYPMLFDTADTLARHHGIPVLTTSGLISTCSRVGAITAPALVGQAAGLVGIDVVFIIMAVAGTAAALSLPSALRN